FRVGSDRPRCAVDGLRRGGGNRADRTRHTVRDRRRRLYRRPAIYDALARYLLVWNGWIDRIRRVGIVNGNAHHRIDRCFPGSALQNPHRVGIAGLPARVNAGTGEVDVAQMVLMIEPRRLEPYDVHESAAAIARHLL